MEMRNNCIITVNRNISKIVTTQNFQFFYSSIATQIPQKVVLLLFSMRSDLLITSQIITLYQLHHIFMINAERSRSYTSENFRKAIKLPQRAQQLQDRNQKLRRFHKQSKMQRRFRETFKNSEFDQFKKDNPDATQSTWRITDTRQSGRGFSLRIKSSGLLNKKITVASSINRQNYGNFYRPQTSSVFNMFQSARGNSICDIYPLQLLNSMQKRKQNHVASARTQESNGFSEDKGKRYLKKGTGVKHAILLNVLKSKINKTVAQSGSNYTGYKQNAQFMNFMRKEIPRELRDVIGPEEIFRMANIFTGGNFGYQNLYQKVNGIIDKRNGLKNSLKTRKKSITSLQQRQTLKPKRIWGI